MSAFARLVILASASTWFIYADIISFNLSDTTLTTTEGGTVTFDGTVTNNSGADLNASDFFFNFSGYDSTSVNPNQDLGTPDFPIPMGSTSLTVALFDVMLGVVPAGSSFPIQVQLGDVSGDLSATQSVMVSVPGGISGVPEPSLFWPLVAALLGFVVWQKKLLRKSLLLGVALLAMELILTAASGPIISTLSPTSSLVGSTLSIGMPLVNSGSGTADNLQVTSVALSTAVLLTPSLPIAIGDLSTGNAYGLALTFNASGLTAGKNYLLSVKGTYQYASSTWGFSVNRFINTELIPNAGNPGAAARYRITTLASSTAGGTTFDGMGVAADSAGNVYGTGSIPGTNGIGAFAVILKVNSSGTAPIVGANVSSAPFPGCGDGATTIRMTDLGGLGVDGSGNIYIAQSGGGPILKVSGGIANCLVGAQNFGAFGVVADSLGNVYFSTSEGFLS